MTENTFGFNIDRIISWMNSMVSWQRHAFSSRDAFSLYPQKPVSEFVSHDKQIFNKDLYNRKDDGMIFKLDSTLKAQAERVFGADFSDVRIHTGNYATDLTRNANAEAVTIGSDIYFNSNKYAPDTEEGISLLVHELQHVVQYHNKDRMVYMEDINHAEQSASDIEKKISGMRIHNITEPVVEPSPVPYPNVAAQPDKYTALPKSSDLPGMSGLNDFLKKQDTQVYEVLFKNGVKRTFTHKELSQLFDAFRDKVEDWLAETKRTTTDADYNDLILKVIKLAKNQI